MLHKALERFVQKYELVPAEDMPVLVYSLEKVILNYASLIPMLLFGILVADLWTAIGFLGAFYYLRSITNGLHVSTPLKCFVYSLILEALWLRCIPIILGSAKWPLLVIPSALCVIWYLAPFNHPNMQLSKEEVLAMKQCARKRLVCLLCIIFGCHYLKLTELCNGLILGLALDAALLCMAYIKNWRNHYGQKEACDS